VEAVKLIFLQAQLTLDELAVDVGVAAAQKREQERSHRAGCAEIEV
jgi:hypothetical protein